MDFDLPPDLKEMQASTRSLVESLLPYEPRFLETGQVPIEVHEGLNELGLFGVAIPESFGGMGLGAFATAIIQMELARLPPQFWGALRVLMGPGSKAIVAHVGGRSVSAMVERAGFRCGSTQARPARSSNRAKKSRPSPHTASRGANRR